MRIGDLNKRVTVEMPTNAPDGMGGFTITWATHATIWAAVWPVSAKDQVQAGQQTLVITHRIRIRHRSVFKSSWRLKLGTRYFSIISIINPGESDRWLDLLCKEAA